MALNDKQRAFLASVYTAAKEIGLPDHVARLAASQAALETGYGQKGDNVKNNNFFGMKVGDDWAGKSTVRTTKEEVNGKQAERQERFRDYDSPRASLLDWAQKMETNWPGVLSSKDFDEAVAALNNGVKGKYATDSNYGSLVKSIERNIDRAVASVDPLAIGGGEDFGFGGLGGSVPPTKVSVERYALPPGPGLGALVGKNYSDATAKQIASLHPAFRERAAEFMSEANRRGIDAVIPAMGGFRTFEEQDALFNSGRGVTKARGGQSRHNFGIGFDAVPREVLNKSDWEPENPKWDALDALKQEFGLESLSWEKPHTQVPMTLREMQRTPWGDDGYPKFTPEQELNIRDRFVPVPTSRPDALADAAQIATLAPDRPMPTMPRDMPTISLPASASAFPGVSGEITASLPPMGGLNQSIGTLPAPQMPAYEAPRTLSGVSDARPMPTGSVAPSLPALPTSLGPDRPMPAGTIPSPVGMPEIALPDLAPVPMPAPRASMAMLSPVPTVAPVAPARPSMQESRAPRARDIAAGAARGLKGGLGGAVVGGLKAAMTQQNAGPGFFDRMRNDIGFPSFGNGMPFAPSYNVGSGLQSIMSVMNGGGDPGATAWSRSNPDISVTQTPWGFERTNHKTGKTEGFNPDGSTRGMVGGGGLDGFFSSLFG